LIGLREAFELEFPRFLSVSLILPSSPYQSPSASSLSIGSPFRARALTTAHRALSAHVCTLSSLCGQRIIVDLFVRAQSFLFFLCGGLACEGASVLQRVSLNARVANKRKLCVSSDECVLYVRACKTCALSKRALEMVICSVMDPTYLAISLWAVFLYSILRLQCIARAVVRAASLLVVFLC
jgi:hypothetical protein